MGFGFLHCFKQLAKEISDIDMLRPDGKVKLHRVALVVLQTGMLSYFSLAALASAWLQTLPN